MSQSEEKSAPEQSPLGRRQPQRPVFVPVPIHAPMPPPKQEAPRRGRDLASRDEVASVKSFDYDGAEARRTRRRTSQVKKEAAVRKFVTRFVGLSVIVACVLVTWLILSNNTAAPNSDGQVAESEDTDKVDIFSLFVD